MCDCELTDVIALRTLGRRECGEDISDGSQENGGAMPDALDRQRADDKKMSSANQGGFNENVNTTPAK
ncbi:hypothetical protein FACS189454_07560 [Planctomycetales bacterium]|nr:hypothetical protein FACS189454_07560 [Planctomycetales bacterium]